MTFDILGAILTSNNPRCIGCGAPATVDDTPFKLCTECDERLTASLRESGFPISSSCGGVDGHARFINPTESGVATPADCDGNSGANIRSLRCSPETAGIKPGPQDSISSGFPIVTPAVPVQP
jgi:hypothetical protein